MKNEFDHHWNAIEYAHPSITKVEAARAFLQPLIAYIQSTSQMIRIWHPMRDPHHCSFRMMALRLATTRQLSIPRASLLDTFLLFPEYLHEIQYKGFGSLRSSLRDLEIPKPSDSFVSLPDIRTVFRELQVFQKAALRQLVAKNILSADAFKEGKLTLSSKGIPDDLKQVFIRKLAPTLVYH